MTSVPVALALRTHGFNRMPSMVIAPGVNVADRCTDELMVVGELSAFRYDVVSTTPQVAAALKLPF
jgi:hypothetical protein